jgi:hypothetical protein
LDDRSLAKEVDLYKKEYAEQSKVVDRLSTEDGDEWELKNAVSTNSDVAHPDLWH